VEAVGRLGPAVPVGRGYRCVDVTLPNSVVEGEHVGTYVRRLVTDELPSGPAIPRVYRRVKPVSNGRCRHRAKWAESARTENRKNLYMPRVSRIARYPRERSTGTHNPKSQSGVGRCAPAVFCLLAGDLELGRRSAHSSDIRCFRFGSCPATNAMPRDIGNESVRNLVLIHL